MNHGERIRRGKLFNMTSRNKNRLWFGGFSITSRENPSVVPYKYTCISIHRSHVMLSRRYIFLSAYY
ncbi:hypothetical protein I7I48_10678 [Histoplasma ohiense]|nr:hypothetical protein I7I48_10678 [Histoplasma ohiense (nom. inval.)]